MKPAEQSLAAKTNAAIEAAGPEGGYIETRAAITRFSERRDAANQEIARLVAGRPALLLLDDDAAVEKLDRKLAELRREVEKVGLIVQRLEATVENARKDMIAAKVAKYRPALIAQHKKIVAAVRAAQEANVMADKLRRQGRAEMGGEADLHLPDVCFHGMLTDLSIETYEGFVRRELRLDAEPPRAPTVSVSFLRAVKRKLVHHNAGESAGFSPDEAHDFVKAGVAVYDAPDKVPPRAIRPSEAEPPEPDAKGMVRVLALRTIYPFGREAAPNMAGEVCGLPVDKAVRFVRAGAAEFWTPPADPAPAAGAEG